MLVIRIPAQLFERSGVVATERCERRLGVVVGMTDRSFPHPLKFVPGS